MSICWNWALSLLLFLLIALVFSPPNDDGDNYSQSLVGGSDDSKSATAIVACTVYSPYSSLPSTATGVLRFEIQNNEQNTDSSFFLDLVRAGYYDGLFFFRVVKGFVAQFGFAKDGDRRKNIKRGPKKDNEAVTTERLSNIRGTATLVAGNTGQVFINLGDNSRLDKEGTIPFATLDERSMALADRIYSGYKAGSGQIKALQQGEKAVADAFPNMSKVGLCRIL